ncbi:MAG: class E sortase [Mycobacteriales bacterium]
MALTTVTPGADEGDPVAPEPAVAAPAPAKGNRAPRREIRPGELAEKLAIASSGCVVIAIVCAWVLLQLVVLGGLAHSRSQSLLYSKFRSELAQSTAPTGALDFNGEPVKPGAPVALLTIPSLHLQQIVVNGTASGNLMAGPGHLRDTPLPGQTGWSWVLGRGSIYGAPFRDLGSLRRGDPITVVSGLGKVEYKVLDVRRAGDPVPAPPAGAGGGMLTLATAKGNGFLAFLRASTPVYVDAVTYKAQPGGPVADVVPSSELVMARDTSSLPMLTLLLAILAGVVLGISAARRHFQAVLVWLLATPVVVALAWGVTDQVTRLLPNLM